MLGMNLSYELDWDSYIISIAITAPKKVAALIHPMKFVFPEVAQYHYKSSIRPCIECCCNVWAGAPSCNLELLEMNNPEEISIW